MLAHLFPENCKIKQQLDHHSGTHQMREPAMNILVYMCVRIIFWPPL